MKIPLSFTRPELFKTCKSFFLLLNTKEDVLKNVSNQTLQGPHWLFSKISLFHKAKKWMRVWNNFRVRKF